MAQDRSGWWVLVGTVMYCQGSIRGGNFINGPKGTKN
jgi:hypothetical protein